MATNEKARTVLVVDDEWTNIETLLKDATRSLEVKLTFESVASNTLKHLRDDPTIAVVVLDLLFLTEEGEEQAEQGEEILTRVKLEFPDLPVIILTGKDPDPDLVTRLIKGGAFYFFAKDSVDKDTLHLQIANALEITRLEDRVEAYERWRIVGESQAIAGIREKAIKAGRDGRVPVLIHGESGTGKEVVARAIHHYGKRRGGRFVPAFIGECPSELVESFLFGHEKGAFTGASNRRRGVFEQGDSGVLFIDEIDSLEFPIQLKLLRVLEEQSFLRVGGSEEVKVDVQVVCATQKDLRSLVQQGRFRNDLLMRLDVFVIRTIPLREIHEDVPSLAKHLWMRVRQSRGLPPGDISSGAIRVLQDQDWKEGNVRQLENCLEYVLVEFEPDVIEREHLESFLSRRSMMEAPSTDQVVTVKFPEEGTDIELVRAQADLAACEWALAKAGGKKTEAWRLLNMNDRFAFSRTISRHLSRFPFLLDMFPNLKAKYGS